MQTHISNRWPTGRTAPAFSLIELLTAVSIMVVIIFALYAMFAQTQKALRANVTQVDVLESGRATAEMLGRDLEQLSPCNLAGTVNLYVGMIPIPIPPGPLVLVDTASTRVPQPNFRTNVLQEIFFLSRQSNSWVGTGYRIIGASNGVGTLYRYTVSTNYHALTFTNLMTQYIHAALTNPVTGAITTNFNRVADGVLHLRLTAYDPDGRRMGWETTNMSSSYRILRFNRSGVKFGLYSSAINLADSNVALRQDILDPNAQQTQLFFTSNAVPAYLELELGMLEPATYKQYQSVAAPGVAPAVPQAFLRKQAGKVHLFRQRIPIRTVAVQ
jgi:hypothetical protein